MDRSFWSLNDDPTTLALLGLPTFLALSAMGLLLVSVLRLYEPDAAMSYLMWVILVPVSGLAVVTFCPLPCGIFAWSQAQGAKESAGECYSILFRRMGRLIPVFLLLVFFFLCWAVFFWIPLLILWPRTCLAPMVAVFEDQRRIFRRTRKLMHEDHAVYVLAGLYLLLTLVLGLMIFVPRLILYARIITTPWAAALQESIWAFELIFGIILLTGVAISWCIALTLFYHDLRYHREGEALRNKIDGLYERYAAARGTA